jgi:hypothetical protein
VGNVKIKKCADVQMIQQYQMIILTKDVNPVVKKGMKGVVLEIWDGNSFEVEFLKNDGKNYEYEGLSTFTLDGSYFIK